MTLLEAMRHQRTLHIEAAERIGDAILAVVAAVDVAAPINPEDAATPAPDATDTGQLFTIDGHRDDG